MPSFARDQASHPRVVPPAVRPTPPERPLAMPEQSLMPTRIRAAWRWLLPRLRWRAEPEPETALLRQLAGLGLVATVALGVQLLTVRLQADGIDATEGALLASYALLLTWLGANFWIAVVGAGRRLSRWAAGPPRRAADAVAAAARRRTAIVMPLYNEDADDAFARLAAIHRGLARRGALNGFDVFALSDSTDPACWLAEERAWFRTRERLGDHTRLFYRRRAGNTGRKAGNIAEFCRRWGRRYDYVVILDADSLMSGATLVELVRRMEVDPDLGLLQTWPRPIRGTTLFARAQQFAAALAGPLVVEGLAALTGRTSSYWGHNAIVRTRAFAASCGLPRLSGKPPFGGDVLSHDFVEAALLIRNGWGVRVDADLGGSYEEGPPNLIESLRRDRRWCQGNLQHLRVIGAAGLHPASRVSLLMGIMSFVSAPIWLAFVGLAIAEGLQSGLAERLAALSRYMTHDLGAVGIEQLTRLLSDDATLLLLGLSGVLLLGPKLLGLVATLLQRERCRAMGGALRVTAGTVLETAASALMAPLNMLTHTRFIAEILLGRSVGWGGQQRDAGRVSWREAAAAQGWVTVLAAAVAAGLAAAAPEVFWWVSPILLSGMLAVPMTVLTGRRGVGNALARAGLLRLPEERRPPEVLQDYDAWRGAEPAVRRQGVDYAEVVRHPVLRRIHLAVTPARELSVAERTRLEAAVRRARTHGLAKLSAEDWRLLLSQPSAFRRLPDGPIGQGARA